MAQSRTVSQFSNHNANIQNRPPLLRASTSLYSRIITDWWWWELASLFVSFACLGAIVGVLSVYDRQTQPDYLLSGITLNAYVAVFAAISKAALILPVSEAIGQLKWIWFHQRDAAALWDFQLFDAASRGPWGSLMLLFKLKSKHLASLGATITILGLAFEPFFQQILLYPERVIAVGQGSTWAAMTFVPEKYPILRSGSVITARDPSMTPTIDAAFNTPDLDARPSRSTCSTGNCTWPIYSTLGICHQCEDVSSLMQYICKNHTVLDNGADPCGYKINNTLVVGLTGRPGFRVVNSLFTGLVNPLKTPPIYSASADFNSTMFRNSTLPIVDFYVGYTPGGPAAVLRNATPVLLECQLTWCAKTLRAQSINGALQESVLNSITIQPDRKEDYGNSDFAASLGPNATFTITNGTTQLLRGWISENMPPSLSQKPEHAFEPSPGIWRFHQTEPYDINPYLANITTAMTNNLKSRGCGPGTVLREGTAWTVERFVQVRWAWITLPAASLLGSLILISTTMMSGHRSGTPNWKSSALATMLHGLSEETRKCLDPDMPSSLMEAVSRNLNVQLSSGKDHMRLVAVGGSSP
ncbi:hypothetical protein J1614_011508 [Plenodomus biglobosus]|nr:hypothetical protein J1614_011508 [Plenodomus biglobosus]